MYQVHNESPRLQLQNDNQLKFYLHLKRTTDVTQYPLCVSIESLNTSPNWSGPIRSDNLENRSPKQSNPEEGSNSLLPIQATETIQTYETTGTLQQRGTSYDTLDNDAEESMNCENQKIHKRKRKRKLKDYFGPNSRDCSNHGRGRLRRKLDLMALKKKFQYRVYKLDKQMDAAVL